ncbi:NAD(P)-dependent dehydrogenase, short-chain alcohol dehydrogenase family [Mucilaginibacter pineti]|uniref:NAD(P)-dependent dehydrogenase, short-chain alcohol dehydrogenase family n=2 Tax=Mucilaginibacter pineti TaxID=1391627 RepID=A0A1G7LJA8_9SPHI|nr:NAD(P)-dependent dehydrogenase, short-chain alcohol dehydrogenase family [Mucilaginibacter pineti]
MNKLENKVAVVTGAASGMGRAIALLYAQEGAKVVVSDINLAGARQVATEIQTAGGTAVAVLTNVALESDIRLLIDTAIEKFGTLDILVNNAGIMDDFVPVGEITDELWDRILAVNITGPMRAMRKALLVFVEKGSGVIINVASIGGLQGSRGGASYTASKHALIGLTKSVGFQYAKMGIRCNAIAPGAVNTSISDTIKAPSELGMERAMSGIGLNPRTGESDEIATVALFLASTDASFVNGTVIVADGGWTAY